LAGCPRQRGYENPLADERNTEVSLSPARDVEKFTIWWYDQKPIRSGSFIEINNSNLMGFNSKIYSTATDG
jgi:hypothetical protein